MSAAHINQSVKHTKKKIFWGSFTWKGVGSLMPVEVMMNTDRYIDVLTPKAFSDLKRIFPNGKGIFQQDLASCHSSKKATNVFRENKVQVLEWPGNSPD